MAHWAFRVNLILVLILSDYRGPIYMGSNMTPWVLQGFKQPFPAPDLGLGRLARAAKFFSRRVPTESLSSLVG